MTVAKIIVWVVVEGHEPEKAKVDAIADIADLKEERLGKAGREYHVCFKEQILD